MFLHPPAVPSILILLLVALLLPAPARAQQMTLELESGDTTPEVCDVVRKPNGEFFHFTGVTSMKAGATLELDDQPYILDWAGPGYHLDSGVILEPVGKASADLAGQQWIEVYPEEGRVHVSRKWKDNDASRRLSVSDTLTLEDGRAVRITDVRLHLRVTPVTPR